MQLLFVAAVALVTVLADSEVVSATTDPLPRLDDAPLSSDTIHAGQGLEHSGGKRFLRVAVVPIGENNFTGYNASSESSATGDVDEERAVKLPSAATELIKKKIPTAVTNLATGKTAMTPEKLRVKMLEKLPHQIAAELIFLGKNSPKVHPKLQGTIKPYPSKISGPAAVALRVEMRYWLLYRVPPAYVFRKLGLLGKNGEEVLRAQANYKHYKWYSDRWYELQNHVQV